MSGPQSSQLLAADSFRVRLNPDTGEPEVRGLDIHITRFRDSVLATPHDDHPQIARAGDTTLDEFLRTAVSSIAEHGAGWPRIEQWGGSLTAPDTRDLRLQLRELPELRDTIELRTAGHAEVRLPERKGPNIAAYAALNRELSAEGLLLDRAGRVLETTTTSLLWWQHDRLHRVPHGERVPSVTEALIVEIASQHPSHSGFTASDGFQARPLPHELSTFEVWAVNALHGIRLVTAVDGTTLPPPHLERLRWFRNQLDRTWQPLRSVAVAK